MPVSALKFYCSIALGEQKRRSLRWTILLLLASILLLTSMQALAQGSGFAVLDPVLNKYQSFQFIWYAKIRVVAERLFWLLVLVDFSWSGVMYVLDKNTVEEIAISNVKKILTIGFFYSLLKFSDTWIPAIIHSFAKIGIEAGGVVNVTPDGIAKTGYELALACFGAIKKLGMLDAIAVVLPVTIIALVILLAFLFVAAQLLVTLVESYLAIGSGVILLGFGGSRWTTDFATKYLQYALGTGVKLMILYLIVGVGQTIAADLKIDSENLIQSCLQALCIAAVYGYLAIQIPAMASAMMAGSPSMTAGALASTALTLGAAVAGGGAAALGAGKAGLRGASDAVAGAAGLNQALSAGLNSAADYGLSGTSAALHATGQVLGHGMEMAAGSIGDAVAGGGKSFGDKVAASTGARIASQIEAGRGGTMQKGANSSLPSDAGSDNAAPSATAATTAATGANAGDAASVKTDLAAAQATSDSAAGSTGSQAAPVQAAQSPQAESAAPAVPAAQSAAASRPMGDASTAELGPSPEASERTTQSPDHASAAKRDPLHNRIRDLQGFVPADEALAASLQIDLKHTPD